ncbi:MAG: PAS domain-containing methyl-accepting chemotaxis protein [Pseudomonadota bacterium]
MDETLKVGPAGKSYPEFNIMLGANDKNAQSELDALDRTQAIIRFKPDGTIIEANKNFLDAMGYALDEIRGKHHSMFVDPAYAESKEYADFWSRLAHDEPFQARYKRFAKGDREVWIEASYNPILDRKGKVEQVVKYATDVTEQMHQLADAKGKLEAIDRAQAIIEFELDGTIITANDIFLAAMGYQLDEIKGKNHKMFVTPAFASTDEYDSMWNELREGNHVSGEHRRVAKGNREVWIQASYNPIAGADGKLVKVVKLATDITKQKLAALEFKSKTDAIGRSQAVIEFDLDGNILNANENFLQAVGYRRDEIIGQHHSMFVDNEYARSREYSEFWANLRAGQFDAKVYKRFRKDGSAIYIQASYNPVFDSDGAPWKVIKFASDITGLIETGTLAETTSANVQSVATAIEELSASVSDISTNMARSADATKGIIETLNRSNTAADKLVGSTEAMQGIVEIINGLTGQVNLLALNATIEAARAGDAGAGFAVVAAEVKNLANQTASATENIIKEIANVQNVSQAVADSVRELTHSAATVNENVTSTATSLEQQSSVTQEISQNTQQSAVLVEKIASQVNGHLNAA